MSSQEIVSKMVYAFFGLFVLSPLTGIKDVFLLNDRLHLFFDLKLLAFIWIVGTILAAWNYLIHD